MLASFAWSEHLDYSGMEVRATLRSGSPSGYVWWGPEIWGVGSEGRWCLAPGESFPTATGRWDDGIIHSGALASGTLRFDTSETATFIGDLDGPERAVTLVKDADNRAGCGDRMVPG